MMKTITVKKDELLAVLESNLVKHRTVFEDALEGYRKHAIEVLNTKIAALKAGRQPAINIMLDRPEDHTRDYERVIGMVKADIGDTFELSEQDFGQYWHDDWNWKRQWAKLSSSYAAESYTTNYGGMPDASDDW